MMKRFLSSIAAGVVIAVAVATAASFALTVLGRNSQDYRNIHQVGIQAASTDLSITATASGTIATAYQLTAGVSYVTTVATTGDAVKLPSTTALGAPTNLDASLHMVVMNNGAAVSMNLFPFAATDVIISNGVAGGAGAALAVAKLKMADCWSVSTGVWFCVVG